MKPRVAFFDFAGCEGDQLQVINLEEQLLDMLEHVDVVSFREASTAHSDDYDIAFVEGSITRPSDEERLKEIRGNAKILVAIGACATIGGLNALKNFHDLDEVKQYVYGEMTTRGIINGSTTFGIRSIRSRQFKYVWNFTPEIKFQNAATKSAIFSSWRAKAESDADAAEKVRRYENRPGEELYDVVKDPYEWNNLADDPACAETKAKLRKKLLAWMKACGDKGQQTELEAREHQGAGRRKKKDADAAKKPRKRKRKTEKTP